MKYVGGCHCGKVRYEVEMNLEGLIECNCSICSRKGHILGFTSEDNFKLLSGNDVLKDYQFGAKRIHHYFCTNCGIGPFGMGTGQDGKKMRAINVRCLEGVDVAKLSVKQIDGKSF
ncbi:GFA family protein [Bdellovibrio sp. HCB337]|uniref:GFA family protein n=1 Tax=Bdellovibrio sp. HCB337 TaxID=3394358 RepID=UPI0039A45F4B